MKKYLILLLLLASANISFTQVRTVGTVVFEEGTLDGYTFFSPFSGTKAYMVDNCGRLVNEWDRGTRPGLAAYFLNDGLMLRTYKPNPIGPFVSASNSGGLELVDWNNEVVWNYNLNTNTELSHHDAVRMPNGNILMLTWELIFEADLIELGRDPNEIAPQGFAWNERIIEVEPIGPNEANIVWEWRIRDHYIQDLDETKSNFGVVSEHPELFDINLPDLNSSNSHSNLDYNHFNAIDYHEDLDQILISVRNSDEIWIIDHSTTTEEAASHEGGRYGKGGDILYRYGNGSAYQRAQVGDQKLFGQHGVHWIRNGVHENKILLFNNGNGRVPQDYSTVEIIEPIQNEDGSYPLPESDPFGPDGPDWIYGDEFADRFYSAFLSNAQALDNGNILINSGSPGDVFEVNMEKEIVWHYVIPLFGDFPATQGQNVGNNSNFRAYKFSKDFEGFNDIDVIAGDPIEQNPDLFDCDLLNPVFTLPEAQELHIINEHDQLIINSEVEAWSLSLYDVHGNRHYSTDRITKGHIINTSHLSSGIYFISIRNKQDAWQSKKVFIQPGR